MPDDQQINCGESQGNTIGRALGWPLRRLLRFTLDHPVILEFGTRVASKIPFLYNSLLRFAQTNKIVMAPEESSSDPFEIAHPDQLTTGGREIYLRLKQACERRAVGKP